MYLFVLFCRPVHILAGTLKLRFSHIHSSVMPYPNGTKFTVELASVQGTPVALHLNLKEIPLVVFLLCVGEEKRDLAM